MTGSWTSCLGGSSQNDYRAFWASPPGCFVRGAEEKWFSAPSSGASAHYVMVCSESVRLATCMVFRAHLRVLQPCDRVVRGVICAEWQLAWPSRSSCVPVDHGFSSAGAGSSCSSWRWQLCRTELVPPALLELPVRVHLSRVCVVFF